MVADLGERLRKWFSLAEALPGMASAWIACGALIALPATVCAAEAAATIDAIRPLLDAGEFAPALAAATRIGDTVQRDAALAQIARSQATAGARDAALHTAAGIDSDTARDSVLSELASAFRGSGPAARFDNAQHNRGGAQQADFDPLIDMITDTIDKNGWAEVGGLASIAPFRGGVYVDADGVLRRSDHAQPGTSELTMIRQAARQSDAAGQTRRAATLRKVSLTRLERAVASLAAAGRRPTEEMQLLAGLERIQYVLVYPETGDVVLAGPADHWRRGPDGRTVAQTSGRPLVQLDDLVVVLRHALSGPNPTFGCSITPAEENLKRTREFLEQSGRRQLSPDRRDAWLAQLREQMGRQAIEVDGIDARTHVGQVLVEADYHMKLIGLGLEPGSLGVTSYLDGIKAADGKTPLEVLRWWFTMNYDAVRTSADRNAFELRGTGAQVLSENELLTALGQREHTGISQPLNQAFAQSFSDHFTPLAEKYPVYAELQNVFDLALVAAILKAENLPDRLHWRLTCFGDPARYPVLLGPAPRSVESVINHRMVDETHLVAGVSGGVHADPWKYVAPGALKTDTTGKLKREFGSARPGTRPRDVWWWD